MKIIDLKEQLEEHCNLLEELAARHKKDSKYQQALEAALLSLMYINISGDLLDFSRFQEHWKRNKELFIDQKKN